MHPFHRTASLAAAASVLFLAACGSSPIVDPNVPVESRTGTPVAPAAAGAGAGATASGAAQSSVTTVDLAAQNAAAADAMAPSQRVIYFDYDSYVIKDEFKPVIDGHARALAADKNRRMMVEGHTDERGGREYNLALGQKRAEAVVRSLTLLGADASQVEAVSFGKERPAVEGSDEAAWAQNRRAELKGR